MAMPGPQGGGGPALGVVGAQGPSLPSYQMTSRERFVFQYTTDYFDKYWNGLDALRRFLAENTVGTRAAIYQAISVPRQRTQPRPGDGMPVGPPMDVNVNRGRYAAGVAQRLDGFMDAINQGRYDVIQYTRPLGLELKKVLGVGGFGIACLFKFVGCDGNRRNVVVKASKNSIDISRELAHLNVSCPYYLIWHLF